MMSKRSIPSLLAAALAVAALLSVTDSASAQRWRGGRGFGYGGYGGEGYNFGYGRPYYGEGYYSGWGRPYGWDYSPNYYGYGWNTPGYRWSENGWQNPSYYSSSTPSYYSEGMEGDYYGAGAGANSQAYGAMSGQNMDNHVFITAHVPPNAEIWFDDQKTSQTGSFRSFVSPALQSDRKYTYHIRARWREDGREVEKDRNLDVHPGDRLFVNFTNSRSERMRGAGTGQYGTEGQYGNEPENQDRSLERRDRTLNDTQRNRQDNQDRTLNNQNQQRNQTTNPGQTENQNRGQTTNPGQTGNQNRGQTPPPQ